MKVEVYPEAHRMTLEFDSGQTVEVKGLEEVERVFEAISEAQDEWEEGLFAQDIMEEGYHE